MLTLTHHLLTASAATSPGSEALVDRDRRWTFSDLERATGRLAGALSNAGLRRTDRVGIFLEKSLEEVVAILATSRAGGAFVPINHLLFPAQVEHIVRDCRPRALVTTRKRLDGLRDLFAEPGGVEILVVADGGPVDLPAHVRVVDLPEALASDELGPPADTAISLDLAAILYTSGSTGRPKGVMVSHANLIAGSRIVSKYLGITAADRILSVLPFSFDYGLNQLMTSLQHAATLVLVTFRFPRDVVQAIVEENITGLAGVPPFWSVFSAPSSPARKTDLATLRYITNSGGAVPQALLANLRAALPTTDIVLMYGLTEAFRSTYLPPSEIDRRPGSMGKAIPDTEIYVIDDDGKPCAPGQIGELVHRGPTVSLGYWGQPETTARVIRPNPLLPPELGSSEQVCYSGDLVKMDDDGYLYFQGRRDATIKSSGYRISPNEVEEVLVSSGMVREAAAIGVPDDLLGQAVMAVVVAHDGQPVDHGALLEMCAHKMPRYMVPRRLEVVDELPKTAHGKIDYPTLRKRAAEAEAAGS